ncbi:MAG: methylated-DNA--[protein]-cysteine S-methyltransferase, partial [Bacteroidota bacterium]
SSVLEICTVQVEGDVESLSYSNKVQQHYKSEIIIGENHHIRQLKKELQEYFDGVRQTFHVSLDLHGTDFQNRAWSELISIQYGSTSSYHQLAERIGKPQSSRALGRANSSNKISIVVPCHRVIGKDGHLHGYNGGVERKKWLIDFEQNMLKECSKKE